MNISFMRNIRNNENDIDYLKKGSLRNQGLADEIRDRPRRSLRQTLTFIFGEEKLSLASFWTPSSTKFKEELTFELMIKASI